MTADIEIPRDAKLMYIQRRKKDIDDCTKAIESEDFAVLEKVGHQVKGNAVTFGFDGLSPIAIDLEQAALRKNTAQSKAVLRDFVAYIARISAEFKV